MHDRYELTTAIWRKQGMEGACGGGIAMTGISVGDTLRPTRSERRVCRLFKRSASLL